MMLLKELSLVVFLLLATTTFQVWGQPACTSHLLPNSTVDIDQYNNTGLLVIRSLAATGQSGMADCTLRCCETENCSLVLFKNDADINCLMIHCFSEDACSPIPSNTTQWIKSIRNNETDLANTLLSNYTSNAADNDTSASNPTDVTDNSTLNTPSVLVTNPTTVLDANTSVSENNTESIQSADSANATDLASDNDTTLLPSISSDNVTVENTTGLNVTEVQILDNPNATSSLNESLGTSDNSPNVTSSLNESLVTSDNSTGGSPSNDTVEVAEPVTESILLPLSSPASNVTSLENGTVPAVIIGSNSTGQNSTNGTLPSFNGLDGNGSANNTDAEEADSREAGSAVAGDQSMMVILVATLSVGMLLFIAIVAVVSKKAVDGWQRRHYSRIDYLVNGMYN